MKTVFQNRKRCNNLVPGITIKTDNQDSYLQRLATVRRNLMMLLHYGNVLPFNWNTRGFRCFYCGKEFKDCDSLKEHTAITHKAVDLEAFIPQKIISKHVPVKIDVTHLACRVCDISLSSVEDLITHIITIHDEDYDSSVGVCVFPFRLNKNMLNCVLCDDKYDNFTSLMGHMYKQHMEHTYVCQICGASYIDEIRLKRHIKNAHVGHKCKICGKIFDAAHQVVKHKERIHGIQKSVECNLCSANFKSQYQLKVHMGKIHNVEKYRLKCELCPKVCTTKGAMLLHVQSVHADARFECDICEYKTGIKWMLKLHKRKHFGEKNYTCSICDVKFGRSSNLRAHIKVHTGNFGRVCRWCRHGFIDAESLEKHEKDVHYYEQYS